MYTYYTSSANNFTVILKRVSSQHSVVRCV